MTRTNVIAIGTYRSITRRPPMSRAGVRKLGTLPRIATRRAGNRTETNTASGSRRNSLSSISVSRGSPVMGFASSLLAAAGQGDVRVVQAGLVHAQLRGHDLVAREHR